MRSLRITLILVLSIMLPVVAHATWPLDGNPVSTFANNQQTPTIVSDGAGGAIVTWSDYRNGATSDVYVQRVNAAGVPQWTPDGVALCLALSDQYEPKIVSDGAAGAIVMWIDYRNGATADVYAQRVDAAGSPQWTPDGVPLCTATNDQVPTTIVSDGAGGAIVAWHDLRNGSTYDIYAQRVDAAGSAQWGANGVAVCAAASNQSLASAATDGAGGAIVTWQDTRGGGNTDIYAQRMNPSGTPQWTADGVLLCGLSAGQIDPKIAADGAGGAVVTWFDGRSGARGIYVQRVSDLGAPLWTSDGVALKTASTNQATTPAIIADGSGGAIVTWMDNRSAVTGYDIYARRVSNLGVAQWTANGVALCTSANDQYFPTLIADGAGGAIITWSDYRSGTILDIYAQRVSTAGAAQWTPDGVVLSTAVSDKSSPTIVSDGASGAIVAWYQTGNGNDIYAQHLNASGAIPTAVSGPARGPSLLVSGIYPNPFTGSASLDIELDTPSAVRIEVFDVAGRAVRTTTLADMAGSRRVEFNGRDNAGRLLPSGVYFCRVSASGETITRKMVIAR